MEIQIEDDKSVDISFLVRLNLIIHKFEAYMSPSAKNSNATSDNNANLRDWFNLFIELQSKGFTPLQIKTLVDQRQVNKPKKLCGSGFIPQIKKMIPGVFKQNF